MAKLLSGTRIYGTATIDTQLFISGTATSVSSTTGALQVIGGVGIGGQVNIANTLTVGTTQSTIPNTVAHFGGNVNNYLQINNQNYSAGTSASTDIILTTNLGTDASNYLDLGINNSGFSQGGVFDVVGANSGYLYVNGGNLGIGSDGANALIMFIGGTLAANEKVRVNSTGMGINTTTPGSSLDVKGIIRITNPSNSYIALQAPASLVSTTYTLPSADGTNGYVLQTNGSGTLSWVAMTGGTSAATTLTGAVLLITQQQFGGF